MDDKPVITRVKTLQNVEDHNKLHIILKASSLYSNIKVNTTKSSL